MSSAKKAHPENDLCSQKKLHIVMSIILHNADIDAMILICSLFHSKNYIILGAVIGVKTRSESRNQGQYYFMN